MKRNNIFAGNSQRAKLALASYKLLMRRKWITYADIMAEHQGVEELSYNVSDCDHYGDLKKAFCDVRKNIREKVGQESIEEEGNNRNKRFRYIGSDNDPLEGMRNAVKKDLEQYWQFCQDSAGFFPTSWLKYFFKNSIDLLEIKDKREKGEQVLTTSMDCMLKNIELLPSLYVAIINKQVLSIDYKPYDEEQRTVTFHPHHLKEFNGRWFLFGHADNQEPEFGYNIAIDRIQSKPRKQYKVVYTPAPTGFYDSFFKNIVGVSHMKDDNKQPYAVQSICIRAHNHYIFKLMETKKIHSSQKTTLGFGKHEDGEYGEFVIQVELNNELIGRILQKGEGLEVVSPENVRMEIKKRVAKLAQLYGISNV